MKYPSNKKKILYVDLYHDSSVKAGLRLIHMHRMYILKNYLR